MFKLHVCHVQYHDYTSQVLIYSLINAWYVFRLVCNKLTPAHRVGSHYANWIFFFNCSTVFMRLEGTYYVSDSNCILQSIWAQCSFVQKSVDCQMYKLPVLSDYKLFSQAGSKKASTMGTAQMASIQNINKYNIVIYIQMSWLCYFKNKSNIQPYCASKISQRQMWSKTAKPCDAAWAAKWNSSQHFYATVPLGDYLTE